MRQTLVLKTTVKFLALEIMLVPPYIKYIMIIQPQIFENRVSNPWTQMFTIV